MLVSLGFLNVVSEDVFFVFMVSSHGFVHTSKTTKVYAINDWTWICVDFEFTLKIVKVVRC